MKKLNLEVKEAYKKIKKIKDKSGNFQKTLFHIHTPESHDYRVFSKWKKFKDGKFKSLLIEDYINESKNSKVFPSEIYKTELGNGVLTQNYIENGYKDEIEQLSYFILAQSLYNHNIKMAVVTDHNSIKGIPKLEKAIALISDNASNASKEYIDIIKGVEISCADKVHIVAIFDADKETFIQNWLDENLMSESAGSFRTSLEIFETFNSEGIFTYIAHINSSDIFKEGAYLSGAYKEQLFNQKYSNYIGISNIETKGIVSKFMTEYVGENICFLLDNDSHVVDDLDKNPMWLKCSKRSYKQVKEALSEHNIAIKLEKPYLEDRKVILGLYIPPIEDSFLSSEEKSKGFLLNFSDSLNCIIGGRGSGKSTVLDLLQFVLTQKADSKSKLDFLCKHSRIYVLYRLNNKDYIVEFNLSNVQNNERLGLYKLTNQSYPLHQDRIAELIRRHHLTIYKVENNENFNIVPENKKNDILNEMFDTRYSVNQLVNYASDEKISGYLYSVLFKNQELNRVSFTDSINRLENIPRLLNQYKSKLKQRKKDITSHIGPFNSRNKNKLKIQYEQNFEYYFPDNFERWFFPQGKNLNNPFYGYKISHQEVLDFLSEIFDKYRFEKFIEILREKNIENCGISIIKFASDSSLKNDIQYVDLTDINKNTELNFYQELYKFCELIDVSEVNIYLQSHFESIESLTLAFNINSKVTDSNTKPLFKKVENLSLGQKVVAMLDFTLAYSEYTNDFRPLLIDQPEDNLDSRYIYTTLVTELRNVKSKRQVILVTHNATIVTNAFADLVILLDSNGEKAWLKKTGYPSEDIIKKCIVDYLEGGIESFGHKVQIYQNVIKFDV